MATMVDALMDWILSDGPKFGLFRYSATPDFCPDDALEKQVLDSTLERKRAKYVHLGLDPDIVGGGMTGPPEQVKAQVMEVTKTKLERKELKKTQ